MLARRLKPTVSELARPLSLVLRRAGLSPNVMTLLGFVLSLGTALSYGSGRLRQGGLLLLLAGLSDVLDGSLARATGTSSDFGAFLDSVTDRYSEFLIFAGLLVWLHREGDGLLEAVCLAALIGSTMVPYARARAEAIVGDCQVGLMERAERVVVLIVFSLAGTIAPALWIVAIGANLTALQRIHYTWKQTRPRV